MNKRVLQKQKVEVVTDFEFSAKTCVCLKMPDQGVHQYINPNPELVGVLNFGVLCILHKCDFKIVFIA